MKSHTNISSEEFFELKGENKIRKATDMMTF